MSTCLDVKCSRCGNPFRVSLIYSMVVLFICDECQVEYSFINADAVYNFGLKYNSPFVTEAEKEDK